VHDGGGVPKPSAESALIDAMLMPPPASVVGAPPSVPATASFLFGAHDNLSFPTQHFTSSSSLSPFARPSSSSSSLSSSFTMSKALTPTLRTATSLLPPPPLPLLRPAFAAMPKHVDVSDRSKLTSPAVHQTAHEIRKISDDRATTLRQLPQPRMHGVAATPLVSDTLEQRAMLARCAPSTVQMIQNTLTQEAAKRKHQPVEPSSDEAATAAAKKRRGRKPGAVDAFSSTDSTAASTASATTGVTSTAIAPTGTKSLAVATTTPNAAETATTTTTTLTTPASAAEAATLLPLLPLLPCSDDMLERVRQKQRLAKPADAGIDAALLQDVALIREEALPRAALLVAQAAALPAVAHVFRDLLPRLRHCLAFHLVALLFGRKTSLSATDRAPMLAEINSENFCAEQLDGVLHVLSLLASLVATEQRVSAISFAKLRDHQSTAVNDDDDGAAATSGSNSLLPLPPLVALKQARTRETVCVSLTDRLAFMALLFNSEWAGLCSAVAVLRALSLTRHSQRVFMILFKELQCNSNIVRLVLNVANAGVLPAFVYYFDAAKNEDLGALLQRLCDAERLPHLVALQNSLLAVATPNAALTAHLMSDAHAADAGTLPHLAEMAKRIVASEGAGKITRLVTLLESDTNASWHMLVYRVVAGTDAQCRWLASMERAAQARELLHALRQQSARGADDWLAAYKVLMSRRIDCNEVSIAVCDAQCKFIQLPVALRRKNSSAVLFFNGFSGAANARVQLLNFHTLPPQAINVAPEDLDVGDYEVFVRRYDGTALLAPAWCDLKSTFACSSLADGALFGLWFLADSPPRNAFDQFQQVQDTSLRSLLVAQDNHFSSVLGRDFPACGNVAGNRRFVRLRYRNLQAPTADQPHVDAHQYVDVKFLKALCTRLLEQEGTVDEIVDRECATNNYEYIVENIEFCRIKKP
jgi:hypothetical protein